MMGTIRGLFVTGMVTAVVALSSAAWSMPSTSGGSDEALLKTGILRAKDVPARWKSASVSGEFTNALKGVTGCEEQSAALDLRQRRAASRAFYDPTTRGTGGFLTQATNLVRVFKDTGDADRFLSAYKAPSAGPCLEQVNESALKRRNPSKDISITSVTPVTVVGASGDDSVGYELVVTAADEQQSATDYMDLIWVRVGRVVVGFKLGTQQNELLPQLTNSVVHPVERVGKVEA
jgi:hypothetical protein